MKNRFNPEMSFVSLRAKTLAKAFYTARDEKAALIGNMTESDLDTAPKSFIAEAVRINRRFNNVLADLLQADPCFFERT